VVVDDAIRPLSAANVSVHLGGKVVQAKTTGPDGAASFEALAPGAYFLQANKTNYLEVQQSVDVVAGVTAPPVTKLQMPLRTGNLAFYQEFKFDGFLQCAAGGGNWCFIANYYPCFAEQQAGQPCTGNLTSDNSFYAIDKPLTDLQRVPDWLQAELIWDSTQAVTPDMTLRTDIDLPGNVTIDNTTSATGASPVLVVVPPENMTQWQLGVKDGLALEVFPGSPPELCAIQPPEVPNVGRVNLCSLGMSVQQRFTYIVHVFYGYKPPEGWRFTTDGTVPQPP
jgi:hypothetical protein